MAAIALSASHNASAGLPNLQPGLWGDRSESNLWIMRSSLEIPGVVESGDEDPSGVLFRLQSGRAAGEVLSGGKRLPSSGDPGSVVWP